MKLKIKCQKKNSKPQNFRNKIISHSNIFFKRTFRIFQKSLVKSQTLPIKHYKKFNNFWTSLDRWNRNKMSKMIKNKNELVNDGILLKFWISNISIFFEKKTIVLQNFFIKSRIHTIKEHKILKLFKTIDR